MIRAAIVGAVLALAAPAHASVWDDASSGENSRELAGHFHDLMARADEAATAANAEAIRAGDRIKLIDAAIELYKDAASADPKSGEPYERIGKLIYSFYFEACELTSNRSPLCPVAMFANAQADPALINTDPQLHKRAEQMIAAWAAFEERAPLDPRIDHQFLFERAIINTKLATRPHLEAAARDYELIITRYGRDNDDSTFGNLAETYMMLGRLDESIAMYERAVAGGASSGAVYGLAVALDRDERTVMAHELIVDAGPQAYVQFLTEVRQFRWFFVPPGEKFYYIALVEEAFGQLDSASADFEAFIKSGAHPMYQPRAKAHLADLQVQRKLHPPILRPGLPYDPFEE